MQEGRLGCREMWVRILRWDYVVLGWRWIVASGMGITNRDEVQNRNRRGLWSGGPGREGEDKEDVEVKKTVLKLNNVEI